MGIIKNLYLRKKEVMTFFMKLSILLKSLKKKKILNLQSSLKIHSKPSRLSINF